jgi:hypothetical protein
VPLGEKIPAIGSRETAIGQGADVDLLQLLVEVSGSLLESEWGGTWISVTAICSDPSA